MTATHDTPAPAVELGDLIDQIVGARRDLSEDERQQLATVLWVDCPRDDERTREDRGGPGCGARAGHECINLRDGGRLGRLLWHEVRRRRAGLQLRPVDPHELRGLPKRLSETERGERMRRASGKAYPGWENDHARWADR